MQLLPHDLKFDAVAVLLWQLFLINNWSVAKEMRKSWKNKYGNSTGVRAPVPVDGDVTAHCDGAN